MFLLQGELEIFRKLFTDPISALHPFVLIPLLGQILLLLTLFQKQPGRLLTWIGMAGIGLLLGFMFVIGAIGMHITVALSTIPFLVAAVWTLHHLLATRQRPI